MQDRWEINNSGLIASMAILQSDQVYGIDLKMQEPDVNTVCEEWKNRGLAYEAENGFRLESSFEMSLLTIFDPDAYLCLHSLSSETELFNLYLHGETIVLVMKERDDDIYRIFWVPFITLAIGGLYDFFVRSAMVKNENGDILCYIMMAKNRKEVSGSISRLNEVYTLSTEEQNDRTGSKEDVFAILHHFLVYAHSACMEGAMNDGNH